MDTPLAKATVTQDEYLAWMQDPRTQWVLGALETLAQAQEAEWGQALSAPSDVLPMLQIELRTRADAYRAVAETEYEAVCSALGQEPVAE